QRQPPKATWDTLIIMATILRLPYTLAIALDSRGGLPYGLPHLYAVSTSARGLQWSKSTAHPAVSYPPGDAAVYHGHIDRRRPDAQRPTPPSPTRAATRAHEGTHADDGTGYPGLHNGLAGVGTGAVDDQHPTGAAQCILCVSARGGADDAATGPAAASS